MRPLPCPGSCNAVWRRATATYRVAYRNWLFQDLATRGDPPEDVHIRPIMGEPVHCSACVVIVRRALEEIGDSSGVLAAMIDGFRPAPSGPGAKGGGAWQSPSHAVDALDELLSALMQVEDSWRARSRHPRRPRRRRGADSRQKSLAYLLVYLDDILSHPESPAFSRAAIAWRNRLRAMTHTEVSAARQGTCPRCRFSGTLYSNGDGVIRCKNNKCGRIMREDEYIDLVVNASGGYQVGA